MVSGIFVCGYHPKDGIQQLFVVVSQPLEKASSKILVVKTLIVMNMNQHVNGIQATTMVKELSFGNSQNALSGVIPPHVQLVRIYIQTNGA